MKKTDIGHRIKVARVDARMNQEDLARKIKVDPCTISLWESNSRNLSAQRLGQIALILNKPISYFYYETNG